MNIHPIAVHFPIALLTVYAILELLSGMSWLRNQPWKTGVKSFLLVVGTVFAFFTLSTGEGAEQTVTDRSLHSLVETHAFFASASTYIFLGLALIYIFRTARTRLWYVTKVPKVLRTIIDWYSRAFDRRWFIALVALVGLVAITVTGALGGAIVYGPDVDPIVKAIYNIFF